MDTANAQAGPSTTTRKPRGPHPSPTTPRPTARKLRPPPPAPTGPSRGSRRPPPTLPLKVLQGAGVRRTDTQHAGNYSRATVFVTRKTGLAALLARARKLVMDEGCVASHCRTWPSSSHSHSWGTPYPVSET